MVTKEPLKNIVVGLAGQPDSEKGEINKGGMDFGSALNELKAGNKVCRDAWNSNGLWVELQHPDERNGLTSPRISLSYPGDREATLKTRVPFLPSQDDVLAEDWQVVA